MVTDFTQNETAYDEEQGGGMTSDTPVWICAFANNQHELTNDITANPAESAFAKAMSIANYRVMLILDVQNKVFTRLWCIYELYLTLILSHEVKNDGLLALYTYHVHWSLVDNGAQVAAVGLIPNDGCTKDSISLETAVRQSNFPIDRLLNALHVSIQNAEASRNEDRKHILNTLVDRKMADLELEPFDEHENYEKLNNVIRGAIASTEAGIVAAHDANSTEYWDVALKAMRYSSTTKMKIDKSRFSPIVLGGETYDDIFSQQFPSKDVVSFFQNLPIVLEKLEIEEYPLERVAMDALLDWLENSSKSFKHLSMRCICIGGTAGGKECGERLAKFLAREDCKLESIQLNSTDLFGSRNVNTWVECLKKSKTSAVVVVLGLSNKFVEDMAKWSVEPKTSISHPDSNIKGSIFWDGTTFPDAILSESQKERIDKTYLNFLIS